MKTALLLTLFLLFVGNLYSQTLTVKDSESGETLDFVSIYHQPTKLLVNTDASGKADIGKFKGFDKIEFRLFGYRTYTTNYAGLQNDDFQVLLQPSHIILQQAVVSATRWSQSRQEIPSKITGINKEDVRLQNPQTAADLLGISGEVYIQKSQQGGGSPMIRGFSTNRLLYTIDGVRMNTAIFRSGNIQNVISLDPFATESTEIFFGPGSIIYGSDAIGAVMSFQTLTPQLSLTDKTRITGSAVVRTSTANNEKTGHFDISIGGKKWASVSSVSYTDYGHLKMGSNGPESYLKPFLVRRVDGDDVIIPNENPENQIPTAYSQLNLMQKFRFSPNNDWDVQYAFHYSETSSFSRYDRHLRLGTNGLPRSAEWRYGPQTWMMKNLQISYNRENSIFDQANLRLAHQRFGESRIDRDFNDPVRRTRTEQVTAISANLDFLKNLGTSSKLFYGVEGVLNDVNSFGVNENIISASITQGPSRYPLSSWTSLAAYLSFQKKITAKTLIQMGLRYNRFGLEADFANNQPFYPLPYNTADINNGALTGSMGLVYTPAESWSVHASASTGFRSPNVDDLGKIFDSEPETVLVPNLNLQAEYAYNAELNIGKVLGDHVMLDVTGYYTLLDNAIVRRDFTIAGRDSILYDGQMSKVLALQNAAQARIYGIQGALEIKFPVGFSFSTRLNYQKGIEETDDGLKSPSRHAPPLFGVARLELKKRKIRLQLYSEYSGEMAYQELPLEERGKPELYASDGQDNPYSPSWITLNFKGIYELKSFLSLSAGLENITDLRYRAYSSGIVAPGRNFIISLRANF